MLKRSRAALLFLLTSPLGALGAAPRLPDTAATAAATIADKTDWLF